MKPLVALFLGSGVLVLLAGLSLGMVMAIGDDASLMPVHAHLNLVGFVTLTLYGLFYQVFPAQGRWPFVHYGLALAAALCLPLGMALIILGDAPVGEPVSFLGMVAMVGAALVFARAIVVARRGTPLR